MENRHSKSFDDKILFDKEAISTHYDLSPEFYSKFLGPRMAYSCAYFTRNDQSLEEAEINKLSLLAKKLQLKPTDYLLDIGSGWGSFLFYAAENVGCKAEGITLAAKQEEFVNKESRSRKFGSLVSAKIMHAYDLQYKDQTFDKIVTVGAIEHMEDLQVVFNESSRILKDDGLMLIHGMTQPWYNRMTKLNGEKTEFEELVKKHFGIGYFKSLWEVIQALEFAGFEVLDHENITRHYQYTVEAWLRNLEENESSIADVLVTDEKYREFVAFMAAYSVSFEMSGILCNQILCKKIKENEFRMELPLTRDHMNI